jgi:hypothetical protein
VAYFFLVRPHSRCGKFGIVLLIVLILDASTLTADTLNVIDGVTFAAGPHTIFAPLQEIAAELGWQVQTNLKSRQISLNNCALDAARLRKLPDGTVLAPLDELQRAGATTTWSDDGMEVLISANGKRVALRFAEKHVEVELSKQRLRAYQGTRLVLDSHISSGREGKKTPAGDFKAGPVKSPMHRSRLYHYAPMPWSVQVHKNVFIHGFRRVPLHPASHGCIRLPLAGANPAKWFYDWIDIGTAVSIRGHWPAPRVVANRSSGFAVASSFLKRKIVIGCVAGLLVLGAGSGLTVLWLQRRRHKHNQV